MKNILFILLLCALRVTAANVCVGPSNTGSGSGLDWNNQKALSSFATNAFVRGNVYYFADGPRTSYLELQCNTAPSGTTLITFKKATIADHGTATGWSDAYGDGQAIFNLVSISTDYVVFDGQTGGAAVGTQLVASTTWTTGFGFVIDTSWQTSATAYPAIFFGEQDQDFTDHCTVRHFEVIGDGGDGLSTSGQTNDGVASWGSTSLVVEYAYIHDMGRCIFVCVNQSNGIIWQYTYTGKYEYSASEHSELASTRGINIKFRYNIFSFFEGTGGLMFFNPTGGNEIYGNVFFHSTSDTTWSYAGNGLVGSKDGAEPVSNALIYNNTFYRPYSDNTSGGPQIFGFYMSTDSTAKNNLYYGQMPSSPAFTQVTHDYNLYQALSGASAPTETNRQVVASGNPFINAEGLNFGLTINTNPGTDLGSPYNVDMFGNTRSTWTRGAIEFQAATKTFSSSSKGATIFHGPFKSH